MHEESGSGVGYEGKGERSKSEVGSDMSISSGENPSDTSKSISPQQALPELYQVASTSGRQPLLLLSSEPQPRLSKQERMAQKKRKLEELMYEPDD